jgi:hypothetical protein
VFRHGNILAVALASAALTAADARGQDAGAPGAAPGSAAKAGYHLFRPTPRPLLRDLSTDRPDLTESPYTVDAGHAQIEVEAVTLTRDERQDGASYAGFLVKLGLLPHADLQLGFESLHETFDLGHLPVSPDDDAGPSNLTVRLKWNLWGNDGGSTAFALMPYVELPTAEGETDAAYGLILPLGLSGPWGTGLGTMAQVDVLPDANGDGRHAEWLFTATVARDLFGSVAGFVEGASGLRPRSEGTWTGLVNTGLTLAVTPDVQLDTGARLGISDAAEGVAVFLGVSYRR